MQSFGEEKAWEMLVAIAGRCLEQTGGDDKAALEMMLGDGIDEMNTIRRDLWPRTIRRAIAVAEEREAEQGGG